MNQRKAFIFDIDKTLTVLHTGGNFNSDTMNITHVMGGPDRMQKLVNIFRYLRKAGHLVFFNTRGYKDSAVNLLLTTNLLDTVTNGVNGVYAAMNNRKTETAKFIMDTPYWHLHKVKYLDDIARKYNLSKDQMYFFDDTVKNVNTAIEHGYKNSFIVHENLLEILSTLKNDSKPQAHT